MTFIANLTVFTVAKILWILVRIRRSYSHESVVWFYFGTWCRCAVGVRSSERQPKTWADNKRIWRIKNLDPAKDISTCQRMSRWRRVVAASYPERSDDESEERRLRGNYLAIWLLRAIVFNVAWCANSYDVGVSIERYCIRPPRIRLHVTTAGKLFTHTRAYYYHYSLILKIIQKIHKNIPRLPRWQMRNSIREKRWLFETMF